MRTGGSVLAALVVAGTAAAQQQRPTITAYEVRILLPDTGQSISACVTIRYRLGSTSDRTLRLDLVGMTIDSIWEGQHSYDGRVLSILPNHWYVGGNRTAVCYHGVPQDGLIIGPNAHGRRVAFADNWPERARFWLPVVDHPSAKATVAFQVRTPAGWRYLSNGRPEDGMPDATDRADSGLLRVGWREAHRIPTYTMVIGAGEFTVSQHRPVINRRDTIPIEVWAYLEDSAYADSVPFRRATAIVEVMQRLIGPFPYEKLAHVQSSTRFGGMENASAIFYAEKPYVERRMGEGVVRHETAHQWFGDAVTPRDWPHLWLSEGFASYFDWVIGAALDGDSVLKRGMRANAEAYFASDVTDRPIVDSANAGDPIKLLNANSYPKASWVLHMLRGLMGDSAFFRGLRTYYRTYRDSTATSEEFQEIMETAAGTELGWFFRQWLHQPGYPQLDVSWQYDSTAGRVLVGITQRQKPDWGLFRLPVLTLEFRGPGGVVQRRDVAVMGRQTFPRFDLPFAPAEVRVDPDGKLLVRSTLTPASGN
jgi:aminopeptidase N